MSPRLVHLTLLMSVIPSSHFACCDPFVCVDSGMFCFLDTIVDRTLDRKTFSNSAMIYYLNENSVGRGAVGSLD